MIFSPHPDDECIIGALPLRISRESEMRVVNVAVTLGSKKSRRTARLKELKAACGYLGFEIALLAPGGLERITPESRKKEPSHWNHAVQLATELIREQKPDVIFAPHGKDVHPAHLGTHWLVMDALKRMPKNFACKLVETEFWGQMESPNLMVESSARDVADLVAALSLHRGEVRRNAYHLRLPAWMMDNVRRGAELVGGKGGKAPRFSFATLYRVGGWRRGRRETLPTRPSLLSSSKPPRHST